MPTPSTRYQEAREFHDAYAASKADRLRQLAANDDPFAGIVDPRDRANHAIDAALDELLEDSKVSDGGAPADEPQPLAGYEVVEDEATAASLALVPIKANDSEVDQESRDEAGKSLAQAHEQAHRLPLGGTLDFVRHLCAMHAHRYRSKRSTSRLNVAANVNRIDRPWRDLSADEKEIVILDAAEQAGAWSFRLTFDPRREAALRAAAARGENIKQMIADEIARQFRKHSLPVPPFAFVLEEASDTDRLHIHGARTHAGDVPEKLVRECFVAAGGWKVDTGGNRQFWQKPGYTLPRYFAYSRKDDASVMRRLGIGDVTFITNPMRRHGRDWHEANRRAAKVKPVPAAQEETPTTIEVLDALDEQILAEPDQAITMPAAPQCDVVDADQQWIADLHADLDAIEITPAAAQPAAEPVQDDQPAAALPAGVTADEMRELLDVLADLDLDADDQDHDTKPAAADRPTSTTVPARTQEGTAGARKPVPAVYRAGRRNAHPRSRQRPCRRPYLGTAPPR